MEKTKRVTDVRFEDLSLFEQATAIAMSLLGCETRPKGVTVELYHKCRCCVFNKSKTFRQQRDAIHKLLKNTNIKNTCDGSERFYVD